jgi:hypothetical protein
MNGPGASSSEMPEFPFPRRPGGELDEPLLDALLNGQPLPPDAPEQVRVVADMLVSLAGPPSLGELAGEAAARSAFTRAASRAVVRRSARWRPSWLPARVSAGLAAGLAAAVVGLGGAAAAYAGELPGPIQDLAHHMLHALPARPASHPKPQPGKQKPHARSRPAEPGNANGQGNANGPANGKDHANVKGHANGKGHANVKGHANGKGHANVKGHANGKGHANVKGHANGKGHANVKGHANAKANGMAKSHASAKHIATRGGPAAQPGTGKPAPAHAGPRGKPGPRETRILARGSAIITRAAELARVWSL